MSEFKGFRFGVKELVCEVSGPLLDFLLPWTPQALELLELGSVYVNEERSLNPQRALSFGDKVRVHTEPRRFTVPADLSKRVLSETSDYLVIEKPAGLPTEPTVDNLKENLVEALADLRGIPLFQVHSLEIESRGLVMIAKSLAAQSRMKAAFASSAIERTYAVFTEKSVAEIEGVRITESTEMKAETEILAEGNHVWKLARPLTSYCHSTLVSSRVRPAEIRKSLADRGTPVIGDLRNGSAVELSEMDSGKAAIALVITALAPA